MSNEMEKKGVVVGGFYFENEAEIEQAKKEVEGVKYVKNKIDMKDPEMVLDVYNSMIRQDLFETPIGLSYMKELQAYLVSIPFIKKSDILPIRVRHPVLDEQMRHAARMLARARSEARKAVPKVQNVDYKKRFQAAVGACVVLLLCIVGMFVISSTSGNPTIINYENELIDRYEAWEQELTDRETQIKQREAELGIVP